MAALLGLDLALGKAKKHTFALGQMMLSTGACKMKPNVQLCLEFPLQASTASTAIAACATCCA